MPAGWPTVRWSRETSADLPHSITTGFAGSRRRPGWVVYESLWTFRRRTNREGVSLTQTCATKEGGDTPMARTKALTELTVADLWKEVKDPATLWGDLTPQARRTLKLLLQNRMHEELTAYLGAERYARRAGRGGVRNGVYRRQLITTWGTIPDLEIPRSRDGGFRPAVVPRYQRRMADVDRLIRSVFLAGVSTRRGGRALAEILGDQVSASTVSTITRTLDHTVYAWHRRPLPDQYRYLILDGLSLPVKTPHPPNP